MRLSPALLFEMAYMLREGLNREIVALEQKNPRVRADDKQVVSCSLMAFADRAMCIAQWDFLYDKKIIMKHLSGVQEESLMDFSVFRLGSS